jgi:hypothetical protein
VLGPRHERRGESEDQRRDRDGGGQPQQPAVALALSPHDFNERPLGGGVVGRRLQRLRR